MLILHENQNLLFNCLEFFIILHFYKLCSIAMSGKNLKFTIYSWSVGCSVGWLVGEILWVMAIGRFFDTIRSKL